MRLRAVHATTLTLLLGTPLPCAAESSTTVVPTTVPATSTTRVRRGAATGRDLEGMPVGIPGFGIPGPVHQPDGSGEDSERKPAPATK